MDKSQWRHSAASFLVALATLLIGAAGGLVAFEVHSRASLLRWTATSTDQGLRINCPTGTSPSQIAISGDRLVFAAEPYLILVDLKSGRARCIDTIGEGSYYPGVSVSGDRVGWSVDPREENSETRIVRAAFVLDLRSGRRMKLPGTSAPGVAPFLSGENIAWVRETNDGKGQELMYGNLQTCRFSSIESGQQLGQPTIDGHDVAWSKIDYLAGRAQIFVHDVTDGREWTCRPPMNAGKLTSDCAYSRRFAVWVQGAKASPQMVTLLLQKPSSEPLRVTQSRMITGLAISGDSVFWAERRNLESPTDLKVFNAVDGTMVRLSTVENGFARGPEVSDKVLAWTVEARNASFVEIMRVRE